MLKQVYISNFVLIESLTLPFHPGFSAFTGETGAGKSILIDALSLLCGGRSNVDYIRHGTKKALIEGVFEIAQTHPVRERLSEYGFELEDNQLIVSRELFDDGKSVARMQHRQCSLSIVKEICSDLVDIHSQHDNHYLLNPKFYLSLLDNFGQENAMMDQYRRAYEEYASLKKEFDVFLKEQIQESELDVLYFQMNEIEQAKIKTGEVQELEERMKFLSNIEKIQGKATATMAIMQDEPGVVDYLYKAYQNLASIHEVDSFVLVSELLESLYYQLIDARDMTATLIDEMQSDEGELNRIQERLFLINRLKRKYGGSEASIQDKVVEINRIINQIEHRQEYISSMELKLEKSYQQAESIALALSQARKTKALLLEQEIQQQLLDLHLPNARFHIEFTNISLHKHGIDQLSFLVAMNKGDQWKVLDKTASGGEISRFMLGLKVIFTKLEHMSTVIFDEIDTGISGPTAFAIGRKMRQLSQDAQVFSVTHLAQVAASAKSHYYIEKYEKQEATFSSIKLLQGEERIQQLALLANGNISPASISAAAELYQNAQKE